MMAWIRSLHEGDRVKYFPFSLCALLQFGDWFIFYRFGLDHEVRFSVVLATAFLYIVIG